MYAVFDPNKTILVDYRDNNFIVEDLSSRKTCCLPDQAFHGDAFKYECDFFSKFLRCFAGKKSVLFTTDGETHYIRLKTSNREGIF